MVQSSGGSAVFGAAKAKKGAKAKGKAKGKAKAKAKTSKAKPASAGKVKKPMKKVSRIGKTKDGEKKGPKPMKEASGASTKGNKKKKGLKPAAHASPGIHRPYAALLLKKVGADVRAIVKEKVERLGAVPIASACTGSNISSVMLSDLLAELGVGKVISGLVTERTS